MAQLADRIGDLLEPAISALGFELLGVEYVPQGQHSLLRVYIDADDGITVDDCATVSHQVSGILDVEEPLRGHYSLEVSSPGLDRPLFKPAHFHAVLGDRVRLRLREPVAGRRKLVGVLERCNEQTCTLRDDEGQVYELDFLNIDKANLVFEDEAR